MRLFSKITIALVTFFFLASGVVNAHDPQDAEEGEMIEPVPAAADALWSAPGRLIQFTGKVLCVKCSLAEAHQTYPEVPAKRLYEVKHAESPMVVDVLWASDPHWREKLVSPKTIELEAGKAFIEKITAPENQGKTLRAFGLFSSQSGTLYLHEATAIDEEEAQ
jgi:hypothetical protein